MADVEDMITLHVLSEETILANLQARYNKDLIYVSRNCSLYRRQ
jgi:myosin heavy subunit